MKPQTVTIPRELPRPSCNSWGKWLDKLNPAQLRAVYAWRRESYNSLLSPKTCWYLLCGRNDPAERARRQAMSDDYTEKKAAQDAAIAARKQAGRSYGAKTKAEYLARQAVFGGSAAILGGSAPDQDKPLQNDGEGPQIAQEAA